MSHDLEAAGLASVEGISDGRRHPVQPGLPCLNCGEIVEQRYCTACGQLGTDLHRPWWDLVATGLGDTFLFDGRLWRSVPSLLIRPGRMTRRYLDGERARFVPPFRMFLLSSVLFFLTVFSASDRLGWFDQFHLNFDPEGRGITFGNAENKNNASVVVDDAPSLEAELATLEATLKAVEANPQAAPDELVEARLDVELARAALQREQDAAEFAATLETLLLPDGTIDRDALRELVKTNAEPTATPADLSAAQATAERAARVFENQDQFGARMREWAPRFTLFFMPVFALLLALVYAWRRRHFIFDHLITALHFQTFILIIATLCLLIGTAVPAIAGWLATAALIALPVYCARMLHVVYATGPVQSVLRTGFLLVASLVSITLLGVGLVVLSFMLT